MSTKISPKGEAWLHAVRLRTLPLALSSIIMGSIIAYQAGAFNWKILFFAALTTILLQILSNLANDYGDSANGADNDDRKGPVRAVQSGLITLSEMKLAMVVFATLSFICGLFLLFYTIDNLYTFLLFLGLGILAIIASVTYTYGGKPYGYAGLGDISVFIFFGLVGVMGTYYLHTQEMDLLIFFPAASIGLFSTAVLNINNIRDIDSDRIAGKKSIPVRLGRSSAILYHWVLIFGGMLFMLLYILTIGAYGGLFFLLTFPLMLNTGWAVQKIRQPELLDPYLKKMAMATLMSVLVFGLGWILF